MARNTHFTPNREPFRQDPSLQLNEDKTSGPVRFLNPTRAQFTYVPPEKADLGSATAKANNDGGASPDVQFKWTTRNNRKGRHTLVISPEDAKNSQSATLEPSTTTKAILRGIWRMLTYFPVWDVSWLVAVVFTIGSVDWVINSFFVFLPLIQNDQTFSGEILFGGGVSALVGATIFEVGSVLLMLEAVNENRSACFGWAVKQLYDEYRERRDDQGIVTKIRADDEACSHHHQNKKNLVGKPTFILRSTTSIDDTQATTDPTPPGPNSWIWWPSWTELRTHYFHDLGFLASSFQMAGATVFWISGFTALPGIFDVMSPGLVDGIYWTPQVIGGSGFIISGTLFMVETQKHWWQPALGTLGWYVGFFNLIGGIGFTLCPIFGYNPAHWSQYQASCATFWGSWAFLIGSVLQWYESLDKHPVEVDKSVPKHD